MASFERSIYILLAIGILFCPTILVSQYGFRNRDDNGPQFFVITGKQEHSSSECTFWNIDEDRKTQESNKNASSLEKWRHFMGPRIDPHRLASFMKLPQKREAGTPFLFRNFRTGKEAIICLVPKTGSTTWKQLLAEGKGLQAAGKMLHRQDVSWKEEAVRRFQEQNIKPFPGLASSKAETARALADTSVKRFMIVKNPYTRFLSGYLDKIELQGLRKYFPPGFDKGSNFTDFVEGYSKVPLDEMNKHFRPITHQCNIPIGMTYDYILDVERLSEWYELFVQHLEIKEEAQHGWNIQTKYFKGHKECFYTTPGKDCAEMFLQPEQSRQREFSLDKEAAPETFHATGSASKLDKYYTPETAIQVSKILKNDIACFGYSFWNGRGKYSNMVTV